ncbi:MAG: hypothetical protein J6S26_00830 [Solobacterium sp.]|nr:hypothetical protein [Solobacterium sp.]
MDRSGYILEQLLITLGICAFLIPITVVILGVLVSSLHVSSAIQDEVSLAQLRHVINVSDEFSLEGNELSFVHHEDHQRLALRNGNLVLIDPGCQIYLSDLSALSFSIEGDLIYVTWTHTDSDPETRCIGHV